MGEWTDSQEDLRIALQMDLMRSVRMYLRARGQQRGFRVHLELFSELLTLTPTSAMMTKRIMRSR